MKCKQVQELMGAYLYGDIAPEEMRELRLHSQDCTLCREDLATRGRVVSSLSDAVPMLSDADRQRIAWSVKGATRRPKVKPRSLAWRLAPVLGVVVAVLLVGFVAGHLVTRSSRSQVARTPANHGRPMAKIEIKETTPKVDKTGQLLNQGIGIVNSLMPAASLSGPRGVTGGRHTPLSMRNMDSPRHEGARMITDPVRRPQPKPDISIAASKDSGKGMKNADAGTDVDGAKLPRVTDPKNAEVTPPDTQ